LYGVNNCVLWSLEGWFK